MTKWGAKSSESGNAEKMLEMLNFNRFHLHKLQSIQKVMEKKLDLKMKEIKL